MNQPKMIYRLLAAEEWRRAQAAGSFVGTEHDVRDGFIHFSTAAQVAETAARHYAERPGLLLLGVRVEALRSALRWEPSRGGALFPHLYAALPVHAVTRVDVVNLDENGKHVFPSDLE
jgi:uncharacterized protein (DUF952 family)